MAITDVMLAIGQSFELSILVKTTILLALALTGASLARSARASLRHGLLAAAFGAVLVLPIATRLMPPIAIARIAQTETLAPAVMAADSPIVVPVEPVRPVARASSFSISLIAVLRAGWALGTLVGLISLATGLWRLRRLRRQGLPWLDGESRATGLAAGAGIRRHVGVLLHEGVVAPTTWGWIRPVVVMPMDAPGWVTSDIDNALVHELEHVHRRDWPIHILARFACALYWFHPLVWAAWRRLSLEAERACDDAVVMRTDTAAYAEQLLLLARRLLNTGSHETVLSMANRSDLSSRVAAVLNVNQARGRAGRLYGMTVGVAGLLLVIVVSPLAALQNAVSPDRRAPSEAVNPSFEVASIKQNKSGERAGGMRMLPSGQVTVTNMPLRVLIRTVYQLEDFQVSGGPGWLDSERFNIDAKGTSNAPPAQAMRMMRSLLEERFKLVARIETRDLPVYELVTSRSDGTPGPRLRRAQLEECPPRPMGSLAGSIPDRREPPCGVLLFGGPGTEGSATGKTVPISQLVGRLAPLVRRKVIDRSGLNGRFDLDLEFAPTEITSSGSTLDASTEAPSIFTALQEQLGLKLESTRGPVDVLVIDSVQRPTDDAADSGPLPRPAQASSTQPATSSGSVRAFDVASIKPSQLHDDRVISSTVPNRYTSINITPHMLILLAYQLQTSQLAGGPPWITADRFDIEAKSERAFSVQELLPMLQNLLATDFGLTFHHETRAVPGYSLVLAKTRANTERLKAGSTATCASGQQPRRGPQDPDAPLACGAVQTFPGHYTARSVPMARLANYLAGRVSRVVVDRTGLEGLFDVELDYTPDRISPGTLGNGGDLDLNAPSLFIALQEQLGLKLESSKSPVPVMVIDRIERPTEH